MQCIDVTEGSRVDPNDARICGGTLGKFGANWRNLAIAVMRLEPHDIIIGCSDGIHDNFDPLFCGEPPSENEVWDMKNPNHVALRQKMSLDKLIKVAGEDSKTMATNLITYVSKLTLAKKLYMYENPGEEEPKDYKAFPGKADHTSVVVYEHIPTQEKRGSFIKRRLEQAGKK